jgi:hypothetical protein
MYQGKNSEARAEMAKSQGIVLHWALASHRNREKETEVRTKNSTSTLTAAFARSFLFLIQLHQ